MKKAQTNGRYRRPKLREGRSIQIIFYRGTKVVKSNRAKYAHTAVTSCVKHMQLNSYSATSAEVYDDDDGTLHAQVAIMLVNGKHEMVILFERDIQLES